MSKYFGKIYILKVTFYGDTGAIRIFISQYMDDRMTGYEFFRDYFMIGFKSWQI